MRVLALGGSGGMGRFSSFAISAFQNISKVTIADLNENNAVEFAKNFDDRRALCVHYRQATVLRTSPKNISP